MGDSIAFEFDCAACGERHVGVPALGYDAPAPYDELDEEARRTRATKTSETCVLEDEDGTHRFVRAVLEIPIHECDDVVSFGVWVSMSEKSFDEYHAVSDQDVEAGWFGHLCNRLHGYPDTYALTTDVVHVGPGKRPFVHVQSRDQESHPLFVDQRSGLTRERARELVTQLLHR
jgi:hypothetical protein